MKRPRKPVPKTFAVNLTHQNPKLHFVKDGDSWESLAAANRMEPTKLQHFNFATADRKQLNWYLYNYVGCRMLSADKKDYVFSAADTNFGTGIIVIPQTQIGSARRDLPEPKEKKEKLPAFYDKTCDVIGLSCLTPEGAARMIEIYENTAFLQGRAYMVSRRGIRRGMLFKKRDGDRLVLGAGSMLVIFLMNNKVYSQDGWDFVEDITFDALADAGRSAEGMVTLVKIEMALIMGFVSASSVIGFVAVTSTNIVKFTVESDIKGLIKKVAALYAAKAALEHLAPTLYDRLFSWSAAWAVFKETGKRMPAALADMSAEDVAGLVGAIIAKLGLAAAETFLKQMLAVALAMATFIGTKVIPKAGGIAAGEYAAMAKDLIQAMRSMSISLNDADAVKIIGEIAANRSRIEPVIKELAADLR